MHCYNPTAVLAELGTGRGIWVGYVASGIEQAVAGCALCAFAGRRRIFLTHSLLLVLLCEPSFVGKENSLVVANLGP